VISISTVISNCGPCINNRLRRSIVARLGRQYTTALDSDYSAVSKLDHEPKRVNLMTSTWGVIAPQRVTTAFISFFLTTQLVCFCDILGPYPLYNFSIVRKKFKYQLGTFDSLTVLGAYSVNLGCTYTPIS